MMQAGGLADERFRQKPSSPWANRLAGLAAAIKGALSAAAWMW